MPFHTTQSFSRLLSSLLNCHSCSFFHLNSSCFLLAIVAEMKMEGLPLRLCHSHHFSLPPLYLLRFFFRIVVTIFMPCLTSLSQACTEPSKCGDQTFDAKNSGCGEPHALQLECDHTVNMPLLSISGYQYYLLEPFGKLKEDAVMNSMRIVDRNMWGGACDPSTSNHTMELWSIPHFSISDEYFNVSLWGECRDDMGQHLPAEAYHALECNKSWYYSKLSLATYCKSLVQLPVKMSEGDNQPLFQRINDGFTVIWNFSEGCEHCESRKEICMSNAHNLMQFSCESLKLDGSNTANKTAIALGAAIGTGALLLMGLLLLFVNRRRRLNPNLSNVEMFLQDYVHQMPSRYSYSQLMKITNSFAEKVGEGGFGVVYKGKLPSGYLVAIKMLDQSRHSEDQFMNEVGTIGRIHHVHLVRLMGYCFEEHRKALVYEYMPNGSLDKFIFVGKYKEQILNWAQVYSIALGATRGMAYLHQDCDNCIIHFVIKPHNILLDEDFTPKVADFGLAKLCGKGDDHISMTTARGTPGYIAPEVWNRNLGPVTDKSDVYSFGMVLLDLIGGRKNFDMQVSQSSQSYFLEWAFKLMEKGELERGLSRIDIGEIECDQVKEKVVRLTKVGLWCIQYNSQDRPSMSRVVQMLEGNGDCVSNPPLPFNSSVTTTLQARSLL